MTETSTEFDWDDVADQVVQQAVEKVAIYSNPSGDIAIRQERMWDEERDTFIVISREHALRAAYAILDAAGLGDIQFHRAVSGGFEDVPIQASVAAMMAMRPDIDWKAVNEDANDIGLSDEREEEDEVTEPEHVTIKDRRTRIVAALTANPKRSNRAIAAECDVSDKTVGKVRAEIGADDRGNAEIRSLDDPQPQPIPAE